MRDLIEVSRAILVAMEREAEEKGPRASFPGADWMEEFRRALARAEAEKSVEKHHIRWMKGSIQHFRGTHHE